MQLTRSTLVGHRGCQVQATQNTKAAFEAAIDAQILGIETDLRLTADRQIVLTHDEYLCGKRVLDSSYALLLETDQSLVRLVDALPWLQNFEQVQLEIKPIKEPYRSQLLTILFELTATLSNIIVTSFDQGVLRRAKHINSDLCLGVLEENCSAMMFTRADELDAQWVLPSNTMATEEIISAAKSKNMKVSIWTVNDKARADQLLSWGASNIISDDVELPSD